MAKKLGLAILILVGIGIVYFFLDGMKTDDLQERIREAETTPPPKTMDKKPPGEILQTNMNPDLTTDKDGLSKATVLIRTNKGDIKYKFYPKDAPKTVSRIVELINTKFYNGLKFHRVVPKFVIQGGDPQGNGTGGSGQNLEAEFNGRIHIEGTVAMARAQDPNSADSQFYISLGTHPHLDRNYTVFGMVTEGMDVVRQIQMGDVMEQVVVQ